LEHWATRIWAIFHALLASFCRQTWQRIRHAANNVSVTELL